MLLGLTSTVNVGLSAVILGVLSHFEKYNAHYRPIVDSRPESITMYLTEVYQNLNKFRNTQGEPQLLLIGYVCFPTAGSWELSCKLYFDPRTDLSKRAHYQSLARADARQLRALYENPSNDTISTSKGTTPRILMSPFLSSWYRSLG